MSECIEINENKITPIDDVPIIHDTDYKCEKRGGLNIMYTNTDVLHNKIDELQIIATKENADIVAITETLLKNMPADTKPEDFVFSLKGYVSIQNYNGRGLCFFIKESIDYVHILDYDSYFKTCIFIQIKVSEEILTLGLVYRSPNTNLDDNVLLFDMIEKAANNHKSSRKKLIIIGDFNFPGINWDLETTKHRDDMHLESRFLACIQENLLFQMVNQPTHSRCEQNPTLIDLIITNDPDIIGDIAYNAPVGNSHHLVLDFNIPITPTKQNQVTKTRFAYDKGNYKDMKTHMNNIDWNILFQEDTDVNVWKDNLEREITKAQELYIPKIIIKPSSPGKPKRCFAVPDTLLNKLHEKRKAFRYYKKFKTTSNYKKYCLLRNSVNTEVKEAKRNKELQIAKDAKTNPKSLFKYINSKTKPREPVANLIKDDNTLTTNDQEKSDVLNSFFSSVFVEEGDGPVPEFETDFKEELNSVKVTNDDMLKILNQLKTCKSPGPDTIHPRLLKELAIELAPPLTLLFQRTFEEGTLPDAWKEAEVKPIFKKGRKDSPGNYRPVSLTSIICKIFETFLRNALNDHLINNCLLSKEQFGFCKARSCVSQLLVTINEWFTSLDDKIPVDAAYLDFRKAFDSVPHKRLLAKLYGYGVRGKALQWITSFLKNRSQYVNVNNNLSKKVDVTSGVPQGSVLGPSLFIYFINDLPDVTSCLIKIFADDTKAYLPIRSTEDQEKLQFSIDKLVEWTDKWLIKFNSDKCKILHLGKNNPKYKYHIKEGENISDLTETLCEKDLGIFIDPKLDFNDHITTTIKKARRLNGMLLRNISMKNKSIMVPLFVAIIRPVLEYGVAVWCPHWKKDRKKIEQIQQQYTKRIDGMHKLSYTERLTILRLPSLEYRRFRGDLIEVYKITHNLYDPVTTNSLFSFAYDSSLRSNSYKLTKPSFNTNQYQHFFTNRVINNWNSLPNEIVTADSLNTFKNKIDKHFSDIMYKTYY